MIFMKVTRINWGNYAQSENIQEY
jgi:hypothetical protein